MHSTLHRNYNKHSRAELKNRKCTRAMLLREMFSSYTNFAGMCTCKQQLLSNIKSSKYAGRDPPASRCQSRGLPLVSNCLQNFHDHQISKTHRPQSMPLYKQTFKISKAKRHRSFGAAFCPKCITGSALERLCPSQYIQLPDIQYLVMVRCHNADAVGVEIAPNFWPPVSQFTQSVDDFIDLQTNTTSNLLVNSVLLVKLHNKASGIILVVVHVQMIHNGTTELQSQ